jgi:hypothetical protein
MQGELEAQRSTSTEAGDEVEAMRWTRTLAKLLRDQGRHDEAVVLSEAVLEACRRVLPEDDPEIGEGDAVYGRWCIAFHA